MAPTRWLGETSKHMTFKRGSSNAFHNAKRDKKIIAGVIITYAYPCRPQDFNFFFLSKGNTGIL